MTRKRVITGLSVLCILNETATPVPDIAGVCGKFMALVHRKGCKAVGVHSIRKTLTGVLDSGEGIVTGKFERGVVVQNAEKKRGQ